MGTQCARVCSVCAYLHNSSLEHTTHDELRVRRPLQPLHWVKASLETENLQRFGIPDYHSVLGTTCNVLPVGREVTEVASLLEMFREIHTACRRGIGALYANTV